MRATILLWCLVASGMLAGCSDPDPPLSPSYRVVLQAEGGELPFRMDVVGAEDGGVPDHVLIHNGEETLRIDDVTLTRNPLTLEVYFPHYDSTLTLSADNMNGGLGGAWVKPRAGGKVAILLARASAGDAGVRFEPHPSGVVNAAAFDGRWRIDFGDEGGQGVGVFEVGDDGGATGTIMTPTGDYRYMAGRADANMIRLSAFDGGHAILVRASLQSDGSLLGDTSWGNWGIETWAATRDDGAALPDPASLVSVTPDASIDDVTIRTLDGEATTLREAVDALGKDATIVMVFGSWCPNSADCTDDLVAMLDEHADDGLGVVGLAYEFMGEAASDAPRVGAYRDIHGVTWPLYLAGPTDKDQAGQTLPIIDRVHAYPTLIFLDDEGGPVSVLTGYNGPATGGAHERFLAQAKQEILRLLVDSKTETRPEPGEHTEQP